MMKRYVVVVAGGKGLRMGGSIPKQFVPVNGRPVLMRTLEAFRRACPDMELIVVLPADQQAYWQQLCADYGFTLPHRIATGGETRFHSVRNGLALIPGEEGVVGVHDGVRPFVSAAVIGRCYAEAEAGKAVVPVLPVVETVRRLSTDGASETVPRDSYRLVQTPQVFPVALLKRAYRQPFTPLFTDDASVVEALGEQVMLVEGNRENIKLTTPFDLQVAEVLAADR